MSRFVTSELYATISFNAKEENGERTTQDIELLFSNIKESIKIIQGGIYVMSFDIFTNTLVLIIKYPAHKSISSIVATIKSRSARMLGWKWRREYTAKSKNKILKEELL